MKNILLLFSIFLIIISGCKKTEEDQTSPVIECSSPIPNQQFKVGDTIWVSATISDDENIESIKVSLYDADKNCEMIHSVVYRDNGKEKQIACEMVLDNAGMDNGTYYLGITASDGVNSKNYYVPVSVNGLPRKLWGILYVCTPTTNSVEVRRIDTLMQDSILVSLSGDFSSSELSSKYQKLFIAGAQTGNLQAIDLPGKTISWSVINQSNNGLPWFYGLYFSNNFLYAATQDGFISGYTANGMRIKVYTLPTSWHGVEFIEAGGRFIAQVEDVATRYPQIAQFYSGSASFISQREVQFKAVKFYPYNSDKILTFANLDGVGRIYEFNFLPHSFNEVAEIPNQQIIDVVQLSAEKYLVLTNQQVYVYDHSQSIGLMTLNAASGGKQLLYDTISNCYFVVKSLQIDRYSFPNGALLNSISVVQPISKAHLYYNR